MFGLFFSHMLNATLTREQICKTPVEGYAGHAACISKFDVFDDLKNINVPTKLICGELDMGATVEGKKSAHFFSPPLFDHHYM